VTAIRALGARSRIIVIGQLFRSLPIRETITANSDSYSPITVTSRDTIIAHSDRYSPIRDRTRSRLIVTTICFIRDTIAANSDN
jgi:hypothetical protein